MSQQYSSAAFAGGKNGRVRPTSTPPLDAGGSRQRAYLPSGSVLNFMSPPSSSSLATSMASPPPRSSSRTSEDLFGVEAVSGRRSHTSQGPKVFGVAGSPKNLPALSPKPGLHRDGHSQEQMTVSVHRHTPQRSPVPEKFSLSARGFSGEDGTLGTSNRGQVARRSPTSTQLAKNVGFSTKFASSASDQAVASEGDLVKPKIRKTPNKEERRFEIFDENQLEGYLLFPTGQGAFNKPASFPASETDAEPLLPPTRSEDPSTSTLTATNAAFGASGMLSRSNNSFPPQFSTPNYVEEDEGLDHRRYVTGEAPTHVANGAVGGNRLMGMAASGASAMWSAAPPSQSVTTQPSTSFDQSQWRSSWAAPPVVGVVRESSASAAGVSSNVDTASSTSQAEMYAPWPPASQPYVSFEHASSGDVATKQQQLSAEGQARHQRLASLTSVGSESVLSDGEIPYSSQVHALDARSQPFVQSHDTTGDQDIGVSAPYERMRAEDTNPGTYFDANEAKGASTTRGYVENSHPSSDTAVEIDEDAFDDAGGDFSFLDSTSPVPGSGYPLPSVQPQRANPAWSDMANRAAGSVSASVSGPIGLSAPWAPAQPHPQMALPSQSAYDHYASSQGSEYAALPTAYGAGRGAEPPMPVNSYQHSRDPRRAPPAAVNQSNTGYSQYAGEYASATNSIPDLDEMSVGSQDTVASSRYSASGGWTGPPSDAGGSVHSFGHTAPPHWGSSSHSSTHRLAGGAVPWDRDSQPETLDKTQMRHGDRPHFVSQQSTQFARGNRGGAAGAPRPPTYPGPSSAQHPPPPSVYGGGPAGRYPDPQYVGPDRLDMHGSAPNPVRGNSGPPATEIPPYYGGPTFAPPPGQRDSHEYHGAAPHPRQANVAVPPFYPLGGDVSAQGPSQLASGSFNRPPLNHGHGPAPHHHQGPSQIYPDPRVSHLPPAPGPGPSSNQPMRSLPPHGQAPDPRFIQNSRGARGIGMANGHPGRGPALPPGTFPTRSGHAPPARGPPSDRGGNTSDTEHVRSPVTQQRHATNVHAQHVVTKRSLDNESPFTRVKLKTFYRELRARERDGFAAVERFVNQYLPQIKPSSHWRVFLELAEFARRENLIEDALTFCQKVNNLEPRAAQGWVEHANVLLECGSIEKCEEVINSGLACCPYDEALLSKALRLEERLGHLHVARRILSRTRDIGVSRAWKTVLEGAQMEARAGNYDVARLIFQYLFAHVGWYGPIYLEAARLEERCEEFGRALSIVDRGLAAVPRYGPLWFAAFRLLERAHMQYASAVKARLLSDPGNPLTLPPELGLPSCKDHGTPCLQPSAPTSCSPFYHKLMDAFRRALPAISRELVWKVHHARAQVLLRIAHDHVACRAAFVQAVKFCSYNLLWRVWLGGARCELLMDNEMGARELVRRAALEAPRKVQPIIVLERVRLEEFCGHIPTARGLLRRARRVLEGDWKVFLESLLLEMRLGDLERVSDLAQEALRAHPGTGRLWAMMIQLQRVVSEDAKMRVFRDALREVPKSGEVWCEGARLHMDPTSTRFNPRRARRYLNFATRFTPQYGDSFIELLKLEMLEHGPQDRTQLEQLFRQCVSADPNYGVLWFHCRRSALDSAMDILRVAERDVRAELYRHRHVFQQAMVKFYSVTASSENEVDTLAAEAESQVSSELSDRLTAADQRAYYEDPVFGRQALHNGTHPFSVFRFATAIEAALHPITLRDPPLTLEQRHVLIFGNHFAE